MREMLCSALPAKVVDVNKKQEGQGPDEEVDVEDLVEAFGNPIRDCLGHRECDAQDHHQLAVQRCHDDPKAVSKHKQELPQGCFGH